MTARAVRGAVAIAVVLAGRARADDLSLRDAARIEPTLRWPVRVELAACLDADRDAIRHAVAVELNDGALAGTADVEVRVSCAADGVDAGVVLEVHRPDSARRYRYALDWHAQPADARPRLVGLAVAEAVEASRIELTAVPEPPVHIFVENRLPAAMMPEPASGWSLAIVGARRWFATGSRLRLLGGGVMASRLVSPRLRLAVDLVVESQTLVVFPGSVAVFSMSSAPRVLVRAGGRLHGEIGLGARVGLVQLRAESFKDSGVVGNEVTRPWLGPVATARVGLELTARVAIDVEAELGVVAVSAGARDIAGDTTSLDGRWASLGLAAAFTL